MRTPDIYVLKNGIIRYFKVDQDKEFVYLLFDRIVYVDIVMVTRRQLREQYTQVNSDFVPAMLTGILRSMMDGGLSLLAGHYLSQLFDVPKADYITARTKGDATVARHIEEGLKMAQADEKAGKAPRKLAGAALAAKNRREEREREAAAAETAKGLATEVTENLQAEEKAGVVDARAVNKKTPNATKAKANKAIAEVVDKKVAKPPKPVVDKSGPMKHDDLLNADGKYKSASAAFKGLLLLNQKRKAADRLSDDQIFATVQKLFGLSDDKKSYVGWNRRWMMNNGHLPKEA